MYIGYHSACSSTTIIVAGESQGSQLDARDNYKRAIRNSIRWYDPPIWSWGSYDMKILHVLTMVWAGAPTQAGLCDRSAPTWKEFTRDLKELTTPTLGNQLAVKTSSGDGAARYYQPSPLAKFCRYSSKSLTYTIKLKQAQDPSVQSLYTKTLAGCFEQTRYAEAKAHLQKLIHLDPEMAAAHCLLAQVLEGQEWSVR